MDSFPSRNLMSEMEELRRHIALDERSDCKDRYDDRDSRKFGALFAALKEMFHSPDHKTVA